MSLATESEAKDESVWTAASDMRIGSEMLLGAILDARAGRKPKTPAAPLRLPKSAQKRGVSTAKKFLADAEMSTLRKGLPKMNRGQQIAEIVSRNYTIEEAAKVLNIPYRSANAAWQRIRQSYGRQAT